MKKIFLLTLLAFTISLFSFGVTYHSQTASLELKSETAYAGDVIPSTIPKPTYLPGPTEDQQASQGSRNILVNTILPYFALGMIGFIGGLSILFLVIAGVRFATAYGNEESIQKAKDQAMYAIIGFVIALLSYTIVFIIINLEIGGDTTDRVEPAPAASEQSVTNSPDTPGIQGPAIEP